MSKLLYKGSVKDLYEFSNDAILFEFSDRYSIFDWGEMPDLIPNKGDALAKFTKSLYKKLESNSFWKKYLKLNTSIAQKLKNEGMRTHLVNSDVNSNQMMVRKLKNPKNDYKFYESKPKECFIPLEVIFRLGVPSGSSLLKRYPGKYKEGEVFDRAMIEFSTKWEKIDRMLSKEEAQMMFSISEKEMKNIEEQTECLAHACYEFFKTKDLNLWDGKIEWAFIEGSSNRELLLVDSIGPDELRMTCEGIDLSKEILRTAYRKSNWYNELAEAKIKYEQNFKENCSAPPNLDSKLIQCFSTLYSALSESIDGNSNFVSLIKDLKELT